MLVPGEDPHLMQTQHSASLLCKEHLLSTQCHVDL